MAFHHAECDDFAEDRVPSGENNVRSALAGKVLLPLRLAIPYPGRMLDISND